MPIRRRRRRATAAFIFDAMPARFAADTLLILRFTLLICRFAIHKMRLLYEYHHHARSADIYALRQRAACSADFAMLYRYCFAFERHALRAR